MSVSGNDTLYNVSINRQWRELIETALTEYFRTDKSENYLDSEDSMFTLLEDLYTLESSTGMTIKTGNVQVDIGTDRSTTSTSFVKITQTAANYTPTYSHIKVSAIVIAANTNVGSFTQCQLWIDGAAPSIVSTGRLTGNTREAFIISCEADVTPNVQIELSVAMRAQANTSTLYRLANIDYEIIEYE